MPRTTAAEKQKARTSRAPAPSPRPRRVRYGFIGAGAIAQRRHLPEAQSHPHAQVVALADPAVDRLKDVAGQYHATAFADYHEMLEKAEIDAVVVSGPNALHAPMTIDSLKTGRHVLCEKPLATTIAEAQSMVDAAKKAGRKLMVSMNQRFMAHHIRARQMLESGRLGRVLTFRTVFAHAGPETWSVEGMGTWFFRKGAAGVGVLGDLGIHKIDLMRWLIGEEFTEIGAEITTLDKRDEHGDLIELDDNAHLVLRTERGVVGSVSVSWTHYGPQDNHTLIACESGVMSLGTDPADHLIIHYRNGDREAFRFAGLSREGWPQRSGVIDAFTGCLIHDTPPPVPGEDGLATLDIVLMGMKAARERKTLKLDAGPSRLSNGE